MMIHKQFGQKNFFEKGKVWTDLQKQKNSRGSSATGPH